jgi:hypothetical protein
MLGYSVPDYLLNSMSSMFGPLLVGLLAALVGFAVHGLVMRWAHQLPANQEGSPGCRARRLLGGLAGLLAALGLVAAFLGTAGTLVDNPSHEVYVGAPVAVTVGLVFVVYAVYLFRRILMTDSPAVAPFGQYDLGVTAVVVMLLLLSLFWNVSHYAAVRGRNLAATVESSVPILPSAIVYSEKPLYLQPPVKLTTLAVDPPGYRYAYQGLKLLFEADGKYFLRPSDTSVPLNIVLPVTSDIRIELYRS